MSISLHSLLLQIKTRSSFTFATQIEYIVRKMAEQPMGARVAAGAAGGGGAPGKSGDRGGEGGDDDEEDGSGASEDGEDGDGDGEGGPWTRHRPVEAQAPLEISKSNAGM